MNLMKSFNKKYFKENLKKSKGFLAFFFGIVPLINLLMLTISILNREGINLVNYIDISLITYVGLYIIPIILAISLFGFVFKQKSVDFVMSKPINRKTIYITNIFGGIFVITIFMLLNALIFGLFSLFSTSLVIPLALIIDYFLYWLVAYIFVFIVSSLAVSLAGNIMGTIVIILIILFIYPFHVITNTYYESKSEYQYYIKCTDKSCIPENYTCGSNEKCKSHLIKDEYKISAINEKKINFTAPSLFAISNKGLKYDTSSLIKMVVLSVIYLILGGLFFSKRKMENNEISFRNSKMHYFVKIITLLPISFVIYLIISEAHFVGLLIGVIGVLVYSCIYDLITRKEIYKFLESSFICLVSLCIMLGIYGLKDILTNKETINLGKINYLNIAGTLEVKDQELINKLLKNSLDSNNTTNTIIATLKNQKYSIRIKLNGEIKEEVEKLRTKKNQEYLENFEYDKIDYLDNDIPVDSKLKKLIKETVKDIDVNTLSSFTEGFSIYKYQDHEYKSLKIPYNINKDLDKSILKIKNKQAIKALETKNQMYSYHIYSYNYLTPEDSAVFEYVISKNINSFINYLENQNELFNSSTAKIYIYGRTIGKEILIADEKEFKKEFDNYKKALEKDSTFQRLLSEYQESESKDYDEY